MINKIVLKYRYTIYQKIWILFVIGSIVLTFISTLISNNLNFLGVIILVFSIILYILLIIWAFLKSGFLVKNSTLFKTSFILNYPLINRKIPLQKFSCVSILEFDKFRKLPWMFISKPDAGITKLTYEVNLLNESHINREIIIELHDKNKAKLAIEFLISNLPLKFEKYSPKISRNSILRRRGKRI